MDKLGRIYRKIAITLVMSLLVLFVNIDFVNASDSYFESLDIDVRLHEDGSASFEETWNLFIDEGTELYKVMNIEPVQEVNNYMVYINGKPMDYLPGEWNVNASKQEKVMRYGKRDNELNWGISEYGFNLYQIVYKVENFIASTDTDQMIYWMFVNPDIQPSPQRVSLTIKSDIEKFSKETHGVWGYGYEGEVFFQDDGSVTLISDKPFETEDYMTTLIQFKDSPYTTDFRVKGKTFEDYKEQSFIGSDYSEKSTHININIFGIILNIITFWVPFVLILKKLLSMSTEGIANAWSYYPTFRAKRNDLGDTHYYTDLPVDDLLLTYKMMSDMQFGHTQPLGPITTNNKIIREEGIPVKEVLIQNYFTAILLYFTKEGFLIMKDEPAQGLFWSKSEPVLYLDTLSKPTKYNNLYNFILKSGEATENDRLQRVTMKQLSKLVKKNHAELENIFTQIERASAKKLDEYNYRYSDCSKLDTDDVNLIEASKTMKFAYTEQGFQLRDDLIGFYNYLHDYSLLKERTASEVHLWDDYMIYAAIFGLTAKVQEQFEDIYPNYKNESVYGAVRMNTYRSMGFAVSKSYRSATTRSSGGGGRSSSRGGGGSSGGGRGGGIR